MRIYLSLFLLSLCWLGQAQNNLTSYETEDGKKHLLGPFNRSAFTAEPFEPWYNKVYENYSLSEELVSKVNEFYDDEISIQIYLGTWCGDSKREVTRFLKLVDHSDIDPEKVTLIGLDGRSENRKQGPNGEEEGLRIHRVPTFIFTKNGEEIARIVESPSTSMEVDVAQIYAGLAPRPNYRVANYVLEQFESQSIVEVDTLLHQNARYLKRISKHEGELNSLGYLLLAADKYEEAIVIFKLNTLMYPESANTFDSLGEAYLMVGNKKLAASNYIRSLQLDADNEHAVEVVQELVQPKEGD